MLHGRNAAKLEAASQQVDGVVATFTADLSHMSEVVAFAEAVAAQTGELDAIINNAGVLKAPETVTPEGLDVRFMVNTIAPYLLTRRLLRLLAADGRVVNVSSAAQAPVNDDALTGSVRLADMEAYSQSKLAITMWSRGLAEEVGGDRVIVAVNPGSLLASKMVKDGFGIAGKDIGIGADILARAAVSDEFSNASGKYYDNDEGHFGPPHKHAVDAARVAGMMKMMDGFLIPKAG